MKINPLYQKIKTLVRGDGDDHAYKVISVPNTMHKLGISSDGFPKFFVATNNSATSSNNITRELLIVEYNLKCDIVEDDSPAESGYYTIITLRALEEPLQAYFIDIFVMMLSNLPEQPSKKELSIEIEKLITIFSAMNRKPLKEIQGLWAELLVIERSKHPEMLISAWHNANNAKYDFTMGREKIEVKSTSSEERIHRFSLDQLNPSPNSQVLIASIVVRESACGNGGLSINGLYEKICERVSSINSKMKLITTLASTLGSDYTKADNIFFDYIEASDSLAFYDAKDIPHINKCDVPAFVTEVKFSSNLSDVISVKSSNFDSNYYSGPLFKSLF